MTYLTSQVIRIKFIWLSRLNCQSKVKFKSILNCTQLNYRSKLTIFSSFELYSFHVNNSYHVIYKHHLHRRSRQNRHNNGYESIKLGLPLINAIKLTIILLIRQRGFQSKLWQFCHTWQLSRDSCTLFNRQNNGHKAMKSILSIIVQVTWLYLFDSLRFLRNTLAVMTYVTDHVIP